MAQTPADTGSRAELQEKILRELREAGSLKAPELAQRCEVSRKMLNQTLYWMETESKVFHEGRATWSLGQAETAASSQEAPRGTEAAVPKLSHQPPGDLSDVEHRICQFLVAGPQSALRISQFLGYKRAKDVNPTLYRMQAKHLLSKDPDSHLWALSQPEGFGGGSERGPVIIQEKPVNIYFQSPNNVQLLDHSLVVSDVLALQIGDHCRLVMDRGAPCHGDGDGSHIVMDSAGVRDELSDAPTCPPGSQPGEGGTQEGSSTLCLLEDTPAGHGSRMVDSPRPAGPGASSKESRKPGGDAGPATPASQPTDKPPCGQDSGQLSAHLAAVRLESQDRSPPGPAPDVQEGRSL